MWVQSIVLEKYNSLLQSVNLLAIKAYRIMIKGPVINYGEGGCTKQGSAKCFGPPQFPPFCSPPHTPPPRNS